MVHNWLQLRRTKKNWSVIERHQQWKERHEKSPFYHSETLFFLQFNDPDWRPLGEPPPPAVFIYWTFCCGPCGAWNWDELGIPRLATFFKHRALGQEFSRVMRISTHVSRFMLHWLHWHYLIPVYSIHDSIDHWTPVGFLGGFVPNFMVDHHFPHSKGHSVGVTSGFWTTP